MKKYNKISLLLSLFLALGLTSCDKDFDEVNTDPNNPTEIIVDLELGFIERTFVNRVNDYFLTGEAANAWTQHLSKPVYNDADRYFPRIGSIDNLFVNIYTSVINEAQDMQALAAAEGNRAVQGVALTIQAMAFQTLADAFGDIPVSEANQGGANPFPAYDTQAAAYGQIFNMLDSAMAMLDGTGAITPAQDLMYGGDISKWKKLAASVKFRAMMRISDTGQFDASVLQALANSGNLIVNASDDAFITYATENAPNTNPYYGIVQGGRSGEWCMGKALVDHMLSTGDPRLPVYANEVDAGGYVGKPAGYLNPGLAGYAPGLVSEIGDAYMAADAPVYLLSAAQINLLLAEAADAGYIGGNAANYFQAGINASLVRNGLASGSFSPAFSTQAIAEQLWVSTYMQGLEPWNEWRRTDIPANLPLAVDNAPGVNSIPTRYTYPTSEQSLNAANLAAAIANQGPDLLTTKVDWDRN
ncbi:SusD/RagB family nutrient-binding outer membrane lipoprotein [Xanthomarina sp. GH4-25]|uniref:SusD/RagB family nutrient-binding outer membrane lipoprotein n=1 Tax=Xanthomarina sp. GH4-25 TaxID=3349335 RepID=UPI000D67F173|nr:SusD/RagB family nutrient-binding outer membrane lipoprotein [Flavobacteriaceae bacterium LYZ1037]